MQLALLAFLLEISHYNPRFCTQLDANWVKDNRIGRGVFGCCVVCLDGSGSLQPSEFLSSAV